jgi:hypothetical protein
LLRHNLVTAPHTGERVVLSGRYPAPIRVPPDAHAPAHEAPKEI